MLIIPVWNRIYSDKMYHKSGRLCIKSRAVGIIIKSLFGYIARACTLHQNAKSCRGVRYVFPQTSLGIPSARSAFFPAARLPPPPPIWWLHISGSTTLLASGCIDHTRALQPPVFPGRSGGGRPISESGPNDDAERWQWLPLNVNCRGRTRTLSAAAAADTHVGISPQKAVVFSIWIQVIKWCLLIINQLYP